MKRLLFVLLILSFCNRNISFGQNTRSTSLYSDTAASHKTIAHFFALQASVRYIYQASMNADGTQVAWSADDSEGQSIHFAALSKEGKTKRITASLNNKPCNEIEPQWSPNRKELAFLSDAQSPNQLQIFIADASTGALRTQQPLTHFDGYVSHLQWSPDGKQLSVLYVEKASREPSPMAAENRAVGVIDSMRNNDVQRVAIINRKNGETKAATPKGLYVFEYDWSPNRKQLAYLAALPPGDDNWYIAKLYKQNVLDEDTVLLYQPQFQTALPRWSPDGKHIAFIEGLMSDQGGTGGEIFVIDSSGKNKTNLTPNRVSTPAWFSWTKDGNMVFTEFVGGSVAINQLNTNNSAVQALWKADEAIRAGNEETSLSIAETKAGLQFAMISSSWNSLPEVWTGSLTSLTQISHLNDNIQKPFVRASNIRWTNENLQVQGWLLYPQHYDSTKKYPMLVCVHGGPAWISLPTWSAPDFNTTVYLQLGYFVFFPNPRGSYGQGEIFTKANRRDWGFGDLRDILKGIDTVATKAPVDIARIGILGWSYGGSMAMMAPTQTHRFKASVVGAGAGDWLSYYGQNSIDKWMNSYFNVSPYDDPAPYAKVSAMTYIKQTKTPTLILVGERDGECPPPQSFQYWHALKELGVPTTLKVYADEGHSFYKFEDMIDVCTRTFDWFEKWMKP